jgi:hypothetical protein
MFARDLVADPRAQQLPNHHANSLSIVRRISAGRVANVPNNGLGIRANSWLGKSTIGHVYKQFSAVFRDWHAP